MPVQQIPGFYYDSEKNRYFRILDSHRSPAGSKYSRDCIQREQKRKKKRENQVESAAKRKRERVQRPLAHCSALASSTALRRELGLDSSWPGVKRSVSKAFCRALESRRWFDVTTQFHEKLEVLQFAHDTTTGTLLIGSGTRRGVSFLETVRVDPHATCCSGNPVSVDSRAIKRHLISPFQSEISSINLCNSSRTLVTTTTGSSTSPNIHICMLSAPHELEDGSYALPDDQSQLVQTIGAATVFTTAEDTSVWAASLQPSSLGPSRGDTTTTQSPPRIISIGTSGGLLNLIYSPTGYSPSNSSYFRNHDILSMTWLSPSLLALGTRSGRVPFWDPRSRGHSILLRHAASITSVHAADDPVRIVVSGLQDTMAMYDIRMIHPNQRSETPGLDETARINSRGSSSLDIPVSQPVLVFDHVNTYSYPLGLDVHQRLGLVAAADADASINIYSLITGERIKQFASSELSDTGERPLVRCVQFISDKHGRPAILAASAGEIVQVAW